MNCVNIKIVKEESTPVDKLVPFERDELVRSTSMLRTSWPYQCEIFSVFSGSFLPERRGSNFTDFIFMN